MRKNLLFCLPLKKPTFVDEGEACTLPSQSISVFYGWGINPKRSLGDLVVINQILHPDYSGFPSFKKGEQKKVPKRNIHMIGKAIERKQIFFLFEINRQITTMSSHLFITLRHETSKEKIKTLKTNTASSNYYSYLYIYKKHFSWRQNNYRTRRKCE